MAPEKRQVYLDHAATTPVDPAVVEAMLPAFNQFWGNPSSLYEQGRAANGLMETAREQGRPIPEPRYRPFIYAAGR